MKAILLNIELIHKNLLMVVFVFKIIKSKGEDDHGNPGRERYILGCK